MSISFSVLMSVYIKEKPSYLEKALWSIWDNQTIKPSEIVIVKDGPLTSELDNVIDIFKNKCIDIVKIIDIKKNVGLGNALNLGLQHCGNELIARMDSDDVSKYDRFEKQIKIFEKDQSIDIVSSWISEFIEKTDNVISIRKLPEYDAKIVKYAKARCPVNHPVVMFKKSAILNVGGYKHLHLFEDYYLWIRLILNGYKFYNIQESLLYFRFDYGVMNRRGGLKYFNSELKLFTLMYKEGFINQLEFLKTITIRFIVRIIPSSFRRMIYLKILRISK